MAKEEKPVEKAAKVKVDKKIILKKDELISALAEETGSTKADAAKFVDAYPKVVLDAVKKDPPTSKNQVSAITLPGFGTFAAKFKEQHERTDNRTGKKIVIEEHIVPVIKLSKPFKVELNEKFFEKKKSEKADKKAEKSA